MDIVQLFPGDKPKVNDKAPVGRMYVDGNISIREDSHSLKEIKNLATNGYLHKEMLGKTVPAIASISDQG